jgi:hypothetical protein
MNARRERLGLWLGVLGVAIFAVTLPMTRLATGTADAPQLSPWFVTFGRAALAGALSLVFLLLTQSPRPTPAQRKPLALALLGNALGYPLLLGFALRHVTSGHAAVITALLPLATAAMAALVLHQRARWGFWICAALGSSLVVVFSLVRATTQGHGFGLEWGRCAAGRRRAGSQHGLRIWRTSHPRPGCRARDLLGVRDGTALDPAGRFAHVAHAQRQCLGLAGAGLCGGVFHVGWLLCLVPGPGHGRSTQGEPDAATATVLEYSGRCAALGESLETVTLGFALAVVATVFIGKRFASLPVSPTSNKEDTQPNTLTNTKAR